MSLWLMAAIWMGAPMEETRWNEPFDFDTPQSIRVHEDGKVYVVDSGNHQLVVFDASGKVWRTIGRKGQGPGELVSPTDMGFLKDGSLLVADSGNRRVQRLDAEGSYLAQIKIADHALGFLIVMPDQSFVLTKSNGFGFSFSPYKDPKERRFMQYDLEGKLIKAFGEMLDHDNPFMRARLNHGPVTELNGQLVMAGSVQNALVFYGSGEAQKRYALPFLPKDPVAKMKAVKGPDGEEGLRMSTDVDLLCAGVAALPPDALLLLRATGPTPPDAGRPPFDLVKIGLDGKLIAKVAGPFEASVLGVTPDRRYAYVVLEDDEGWFLRRIPL